MQKTSKDTGTTQKAISVFPNLVPILNTIAPKLGLNVGSMIGPKDEIFIGKSDNPNVIGFTMSDSKKIFLESRNFASKIKGLKATPDQVLGFFTPVKNKNNASQEICDKCNALIYIIEILSVLVHERAHNKMNSEEGHLDNEATAQGVERGQAKIMAQRGLKHIRGLIDHHNADGAKGCFDNVDSTYQAGLGQYRTVEGSISKKNIIKISRLSNNINDKRYSNALKNLALKYSDKNKKA